MSSNDYFYSVLKKYNKGICIYVSFIHDCYTDTICNLVKYWASIWRVHYELIVDKENFRYIVKFNYNTSSSSDPCDKDFLFLGNTRYGLSYLLINGVNTKNTYIDCLDTEFIFVPITEDIKKPKVCKKCDSDKLIYINANYNNYLQLTICKDCNTVQENLKL